MDCVGSLPEQTIGKAIKRPLCKQTSIIRWDVFAKQYEKEIDFLLESKKDSLTGSSVHSFFSKKDVIWEFEIANTMLIRVGLEPGRNKWTVYIFKNNEIQHDRPTIVKLLYSDLVSVKSNGLSIIAQLADKENMDFSVHDKTDPNHPEFWKEPVENIFYTPSGEFRYKVQRSHNNLYYIWLNKPVEYGFSGWAGPKLKLSLDEFGQFIEVVKDILDSLPPYFIMEELVDKNELSLKHVE